MARAGKVVEGEFPLILSNAAEAKRRRCAVTTVYLERRDQDLPPFVKGTNGRIYRSRQLTPAQRRKRDKRIRQALQLGIPVLRIVEVMGVSRGTVWRVSRVTPKRRKVHKYSQRAWRDRLPDRETG